MNNRRRRNRDEFPWPVIVIGLAVAAAVIYFGLHGRQKPAPRPAAVDVPPPPAIRPQPGRPVIQHPVPPAQTAPAPEAPPLPGLDESDPPVLGALSGLLGSGAVKQFLAGTDIIRNVVVTVDNLPRKKVSKRVWPVRQTPGKFLVDGKEDTFTISPDNSKRYRPFMQVVKSVDAGGLASIYLRYYPLFQKAYEELGYPEGYFNDRLVEVIDHLLKAPEIKGTIRLVRPSVYYRFADPGLEARSAGQKILMRLGRENEAIIKEKLRDFRQAIVIPQAN